MEQCLLNYFIRNEELVSVCDFDPTILTQGKGIYEVIRIIRGRPLFIEEHIFRFLKSAEQENINHALSASDVKHKIRILIEQNRMLTGNIRFQYLKRHQKPNLFLAWVIPFHYPTNKELTQGVTLKTINAIRQNPQIKRTHLPVRELADEMIANQTISEVLLVNHDGIITEGSRSNIFLIKHNQLVTPLSSLILEGITREKIMLIANKLNIDLSEEVIKYRDLNSFEACFICSTSKNVLPVSRIDESSFEVNNPITERISQSYNKYADKYLDLFNW